MRDKLLTIVNEVYSKGGSLVVRINRYFLFEVHSIKKSGTGVEIVYYNDNQLSSTTLYISDISWDDNNEIELWDGEHFEPSLGLLVKGMNDKEVENLRYM